MEPSPVGTPGELCISGDGLARGYLNDAALTAEKFAPHPFLPGKRIYRTGDLAKWLPDGDLLFVGRADDQLKIRGHRVEPGEIEQTMLSHPEVGEACVLAVELQNRERGLIAYYTRKKRLELWPSLAEFFVYDDLLYDLMAGHQERNDKYLSAFQKVLRDKTVVEIGPGPSAVLSRLCIESGAKRVYAIECLKETHEKACEKVRSLGLEQRIILIHGDVLQADPPEKVDYCISEIVGSIGGSEGSARLINSARRFLHDPSHMIPQRSLTKIAAVSLPTDFEFAFADEIVAQYVERIFADKGYRFDLRLCLKNLSSKNILSDDDVFEDLDYTRTVPLQGEHDIHLRCLRDGLFHGFVLWLQLYMDADNMLDILDSPGSWLPVYLPVSLEGIEVSEGDYFNATVDRTLCENDLNSNYHITGNLFRGQGAPVSFEFDSFHDKPLYRHNNFYQRLFADDRVPRAKPFSAEDMRSFLQKRVPEYMVPQFFSLMDKLPLTLHGKIDKKALANSKRSGQLSGAAQKSFNPETERQLTLIWEQVLGRKDISVTDNFFHIGGHSLMVIKLASLIFKKMGVAVATTAVFENPTIRELAEHILDSKEFGSDLADKDMILLNGVLDGKGKIFAFPPGVGDAAGFLQVADGLKPYSFYGFNFIKDETRLKRYADHVMSVDPEGPYLFFGYSSGGNLAYHVAKEIETCGKRVSDIVMVDSARKFDRIPFEAGDIQRIADDFLSDESISPYLTDNIFREKAYRRIESSFAYFQAAVDYHVVDANIHLLLSENSVDIHRDESGRILATKSGWAEVTRGQFKTYDCEGDHNHMLYHPHLARNTDLIRRILDQAILKSANRVHREQAL
jgi:thioesterase domain-containing protein